MENIPILDLAQAGGVAILLFWTFQLWQRLNELTDRFLSYLDQRAEHGDPAAQAVKEAQAQNGKTKHV